ncbi:hypothetical protein [Nitrospira sp.]|uniref:hypothetical protein n=1 Tax=Nitrospira sp. TaxID=70125 RepID=UPI003FCD4CD3
MARKNDGWFALRPCAINFHIKMVFCVAGFRPGWRGPFVSAKGPKTIDAPSGHIKMGRTQDCGGRPNSPGSNKVRQEMRASDPGTGRQASVIGEEGIWITMALEIHGKHFREIVV